MRRLIFAALFLAVASMRGFAYADALTDRELARKALENANSAISQNASQETQLSSLRSRLSAAEAKIRTLESAQASGLLSETLQLQLSVLATSIQINEAKLRIHEKIFTYLAENDPKLAQKINEIVSAEKASGTTTQFQEVGPPL